MIYGGSLRNFRWSMSGSIIFSAGYRLLDVIKRACASNRYAMYFYHLVLAILILRSGFFDHAYYCAENPEVPKGRYRAALHYVRHGEREGRAPMPLFDAAHYRHQVSFRAASVCLLLHYAWIGRRRRLSPHPWFDASYYRTHNQDIVAAGEDVLLHYYRYGGREGRSPCAEFDGLYYLRSNPDVAASGINPLLHFLQYGQREGRLPNPRVPMRAATTLEVPHMEVPMIPSDAEWAECMARGDSAGSRIDVIVPVYRGRAETLRCLASVLRSQGETPFTLVVVDDCSPEPELAADLDVLAAKGLLVLLRNPENLGFVRTVNRAMSRRPDRDVVLLNSDTEVAGNWLDRLRQAACAGGKVATVTPLSNSATICSYPVTLRDNPFRLEVSPAELDELTAQANSGVVVPAPTGVGFCMYITRASLGAVGLFDAETFGAGYGEENDYCQRALKLGYSNLIAADVFVWHWGSVSFAESKSQRVASAMRIIGHRYPTYHRDVADFVATDPLGEARRRLDRERLRRRARERNVLQVCHRRGGGTERQLRAEAHSLRMGGAAVFELRPVDGEKSHVLLSSPDVPLTPNLQGCSLLDANLVESLRALRITEIHVHSLIDFEIEAPALLVRLAECAGAKIHLRIHDYEVICPRITLTGAEGRYCGEPAEAECNRCLKTLGADFPVTDIEKWRSRPVGMLRAAAEIVVPDADVAQRMDRYFPALPIVVRPHDNDGDLNLPQVLPRFSASEPLRVAVLGAINRPKGYEVLLTCAMQARKRMLPIRFILMGYSIDDTALEAAGVEVAGRYREETAVETLDGLAAHAVWLPSTWPETYSFTLSLALRAGLPVFTFDLGAIAGRLRTLGRADHLMPLDDADHPEAIIALFLGFRDRCMQEAQNPEKGRRFNEPASAAISVVAGKSAAEA